MNVMLFFHISEAHSSNHLKRKLRLYSLLIVSILLTLCMPLPARPLDVMHDPVFIRADSMPGATDMRPTAIARRAVIKAFLDQHPNYTIEPFAMPKVRGGGGDSGPLMAIAAGLPPHCIYVNFRQSSTYIAQGFLEPMEVLLARLQSNDPRVRELDNTGHWLRPPSAAEIEDAFRKIRARVRDPVWPVVFREDESTPQSDKHVWALPISNVVMGLLYRKDLFYEAGLDPDRPPRDWDELLEFARRLTDPDKRQYGMVVYAAGTELSWGCYAFLVSTDARAIKRDSEGRWRAGFGTRGCAEGIYQLWRMAHEPFQRDGKTIRGCAKLGSESEWALMFSRGSAAMKFDYLRDEVLEEINPQLVGIAPVPASFQGTRGSEVNCGMVGVFAGSSPLQQLAVMELIWFLTSEKAQRIRTQVYVKSGLGKFVSPDLLRRFGYDRLLRQVPKGWQDAFNAAMQHGVPEPYGKNTQHIYRYMSEPISAALELPLGKMGREEAIDRIHQMCVAAAEKVDRELLGDLPESQHRKQRIIAALVLIPVTAAFVWMMVNVWRYFSQVAAPFNRRRQWRKYIWGYLLLAPALLLVFWWQYLPLGAGLSISLMDFRLVRDSSWVGLDNFAAVLFDRAFWGGLFRTLYFVALMIGLGFWPPILLAILLQEVPTRPLKYFYRTVYYLPQVIAGVIVIFLWRQLYDSSESGVLNQLLLQLNELGPISATMVKLAALSLWGSLIAMLIYLPIKVDEMTVPLKTTLWGVAVIFIALTLWPILRPVVSPADAESGLGATFAVMGRLFGAFDLKPLRWIESPHLAMLCVVIPTVWATAGPGCILYLAALKTVPEELYEAADIDGASNWHKVFYVVLPRLKYLIVIQFIAAVIGAFKGGTEYVLVLTGGGPNNATQLLSVEIFVRAFLDLSYGVGTAMAWLLGALLIGFTAFQLKMLSRAEFKAAG